VFLPDGAADTPWRLDELHPNASFVGYLRATIRDGGLPGWRRRPDERPHPAVVELCAGLIPF
jgi:hypothetical protein